MNPFNIAWAIRHAGQCRDDLREELKTATALESLQLLALIDRVSVLEKDLQQIYAALESDGRLKL